MSARLEHLTFPAMGTTCAVAVTVGPGQVDVARQALAAGVAEVAACERALSRFDSSSDLTALNDGNGRWVPVDRRLVGALTAALDARVSTGGRFEPTILPAVCAAGYDRSFELLREHPARVPRGWCPGAAVEIDVAGGRARLASGAAVDLGGIGKGWSARSALAVMRRSGASLRGFLVDLGGDIAVCGVPPTAGPWLIDVADPTHHQERLATIRMASGGIATSGRDARRFGPGGTLHHLIDPATGVPANSGPLAVTVVTGDPAEAEAHATALAITPLDEVASYLRERPHLAAFVVPEAGAPLVFGDLQLVVKPQRVRVKLTVPIGGLR